MSSIHALSSIAPSDRLELARLPAESSTAPSAPPSEIQLPSQLTTFEPNANTVYLHVERPPNKHRLLTPRLTAPLKVYALSETGDSLTKETRGSRAVSKLCEMTEFHTIRVKLLKEWGLKHYSTGNFQSEFCVDEEYKEWESKTYDRLQEMAEDFNNEITERGEDGIRLSVARDVGALAELLEGLCEEIEFEYIDRARGENKPLSDTF